jgi:bacteriorhodopsin
MTLFIPRGNDALGVNPPNADRSLGTGGSDWLWACMAVFGVTFLSWLAWTILLRGRRRAATVTGHTSAAVEDTGVKTGPHLATAGPSLRGERIFHYLLTIAAFVGLIAYFSMASDLGSTPVRQYMNNGPGALTRQIFYVRYIYWFVAWPLVLIALLLLTGLSWATILFAITLLEIWVVSWLCGALVTTSYKWGYFTFGTFAYLVLAYLLLLWGINSSRRLGAHKSYSMLAAILVVVWMVYPISWGLNEGSNRLSVTGEMIWYGVLDLITVPFYGSLLLLLSRRFDHASLFPFTQRGRIEERYGTGSTYAPANVVDDAPEAAQSGV